MSTERGRVVVISARASNPSENPKSGSSHDKYRGARLNPLLLLCHYLLRLDSSDTRHENGLLLIRPALKRWSTPCRLAPPSSTTARANGDKQDDDSTILHSGGLTTSRRLSSPTAGCQRKRKIWGKTGTKSTTTLIYAPPYHPLFPGSPTKYSAKHNVHSYRFALAFTHHQSCHNHSELLSYAVHSQRLSAAANAQ